MLLFHGTRESNLESILAQGLLPFRTGEHWVSYLTPLGHKGVSFLSTSPVAGKGGDPVSFALGWPVKRDRLDGYEPGYVVVIDLPHEALHLIQAVIPNVEFDTFLTTLGLRDFLLSLISNYDLAYPEEPIRWKNDNFPISTWCLLYWFMRYLRSLHKPLDTQAVWELLSLHIEYRAPTLPEDLTPQRWQLFLQEYCFFMDVKYRDYDVKEGERQRALLLQKYSIRFPDDIEEDGHSRSCPLCIEAMFSYSYFIQEFEQYQPFRTFLKDLSNLRKGQHDTAQAISYRLLASFRSVVLFQHLPFILRIIASHTDPFPEEDILAFFYTHEGAGKRWKWEQWYRAFPEEDCNLPRIWRSGYGRDFLEIDLKRPDQQVIVSHLPAKYILGAIQLSDGQKFLSSIRPGKRKGEVLSTKLWRIAHELRAQYAGKPLVLGNDLLREK